MVGIIDGFCKIKSEYSTLAVRTISLYGNKFG